VNSNSRHGQQLANSEGRQMSSSLLPTDRHHLAPKKRFKLDALRDLKEEEEVKSDNSSLDALIKKETDAGGRGGEAKTSPLNPFRPWSEPSDPSQSSPPPPLQASLMSRLSSCLPFLFSGLPMVPPELAAAALPLSLSAIRSQLAPLQLLQQQQQQLLLLPAAPEQDEPLALVKEKTPIVKSELDEKVKVDVTSSPASKMAAAANHMDQLINNSRERLTAGRKRRTPSCGSNSSGSDGKSVTSSPESDRGRQQQRNYKNLTRERRVEANARERQRVHTITAAFDTLQAAIPTEDENAKLSKLSVIKIATAYIMALSRMAGYDYTEDQSAPSLETVIQHCQEVIHTETRIKKRNS
jgi:Helix-loop-helix DNA-binding domain